MASAPGRRRLHESVARVAGEPCDDAVVLVMRRRPGANGLIVAAIVAATILAMVIGVDGLVRGCVIGAAAGGAYAATNMSSWLLGGLATGVALIRTSRWTGKAVEVVAVLPRPLPAAREPGALFDTVTIGADTYQLPRAMRARFDRLARP